MKTEYIATPRNKYPALGFMILLNLLVVMLWNVMAWEYAINLLVVGTVIAAAYWVIILTKGENMDYFKRDIEEARINKTQYDKRLEHKK